MRCRFLETNPYYYDKSVVAYITSLNSTPPFRRIFRPKNHGKRPLENPQTPDIIGFDRVVAIIPYGHTYATLAIQNGVDVKTVSSILGHYSAGFTLDTYTHVTGTMQKEAADKVGSFIAQAV